MSRSHFFDLIECYIDCQNPSDVHRFFSADLDEYVRVLVERLERESRNKVGSLRFDQRKLDW